MTEIERNAKWTRGVIVDVLKRRIAVNGSQASAARALKVSRSHVSHILAGRKEIGPELAKRLGFRRIVSYEAVR